MTFLGFVVVVCWLFKLQGKVDGLERKVQKLSAWLKQENSTSKVANGPQQEKAPIPPAKPTTVAAAVTKSAAPHLPANEENNAAVPLSKPEEAPAATPDIVTASNHAPAAVAAVAAKAKRTAPAKPSVEITAAKLFSWIGGFMLFLGCIFGIKYAVEKNLLSPAVRITLSLLLGFVLTVWGYFLKNKKYRVTSHTLLGSGLAIMYASVFCAHSFYHFLSIPVAFIFMAVISFVALGVSLQKEAKYVGYLGTLIAFLTPILLNNGSNAWVAFFLYVFCINAAAAYAAVKKKWNGLLIFTLSFTWLSQAVWMFPVTSEKLLAVATFFSGYALASAWLVRQYKKPCVISHAVSDFLGMGLLLMFPVAMQLPLGALVPSMELLGYVLLVNIIMLIWTGKKRFTPDCAPVTKIIVFGILCAWMFGQSAHLPYWMTLGACLLFTAINSVVELMGKDASKKPALLSVFYPVASMISIVIFALLPAQSSSLNFMVVFALLSLLLVGALILAVLADMMWVGILASIILFLFLPASLVMQLKGCVYPYYSLLIIGFMPLLLCMCLLSVLRRKGVLGEASIIEKSLVAVNALTPFLLILTVLGATMELVPIHWILGATLTTCVLTVLAARIYKNAFTLPVAALGAGIVQMAMQQVLIGRNALSAVAMPLGYWMFALLGLFILVPVFSRKFFWKEEGSWIACAVSGLLSGFVGCGLLHVCAPQAHRGIFIGGLLLIYAGLLYKIWGPQKEPQAGPLSIGFMSAVVICFAMAIPPLEIHDYWLCVALAAQAVFFAYLYTKLPYRGWQIPAALLLCGICSWLLFGEQFSPLPTVRVWNWYLWVYGICAIACFVTGYLWKESRFWKNLFYVLGGCLLFWLLNIEIAHWFNTGEFLSFEYTGRLAEALTYTLAWALFGFITIGLGLWKRKTTVSKVGAGIMGLALLKFFLSDIWQLQSLYRILGLFGLAILLIVASFWYQKKQKA